MASFFAKARERAEAAAQQLQSHHSSSSAGGGNNAGSTESGATSGSGFSYTGAVPHLLRQGLASVDPRYESNRSFHLLSQAVKSLNIDHEAAGRESKNLAKATFKWGQSHLPENREDSVGDEMLVDITDRLAYIWHEIGQLEVAHSQKAEQARSRLKRFEKTEMELSTRRANRSKIKRELHALVPERAKASGSARAQELEKQLQNLLHDDQADEESLSRVKRESLKEGYNAMFDSFIELGEKMALVARYGKLLTNEISTDKSPFPATIKARAETVPLWKGAAKTAEIRAAVAPALAAHQVNYALPTLPGAASAASPTSSLGRADTVSYAVSHRSELEGEEGAQTSAQPTASPTLTASRQRRSSSTSERSGGLDPTSASGGNASQKLNLSPTIMPAPTLPPRPGHSASTGAQTDMPRSPVASFSDPFADPAGSAAARASGEEPDNTPPGPTVAETGVIPSGTGGPKSGTLQPRRSSAFQRSASISAGAVAYLGPPGTYTHQAALKLFGTSGISLIPMQSITGAIDFVRRGTPGNAKIGIVPAENSSFGPVRDTIDNLLGIGNGDRHAVAPSQGAKVYVIGETCLSVDHALLCGPKTYKHLLSLQGDTDPNAQIRDDTLSNITNVISHEQALGQCSLFLSRHMPQARKKAVESTAAAASTAIEFEEGVAPGVSAASVSHAHESLGFSPLSLVVAIGPEVSTTTAGVRVLRTRIQDVEDNRTRFFVLSSEPVETLVASHTLPTGLTRLYTPNAATGMVGRALLRVHDALSSDLAVEGGSTSDNATSLTHVLEQLVGQNGMVIRKVDRRPAAFYASSTSSSVWKCSYLFELQYPATGVTAVQAKIQQIVERVSSTSGSTVSQAREAASSGHIEYLGSWLVDSQSVKGDPPSILPGQAQQQAYSQRSPSIPVTPLRPQAGMASSGSSSSGFSDLATPGHGGFSQGMPASSSSSSSVMSDSTVHPFAAAALSERERKELEAQQEAEQVRRHAAEARFSRQQQQAELYGVQSQQPQQSQVLGLQTHQTPMQTQQTQRLGGLQESQEEAAADAEEEGLPAYQPMDPSARG